MNVKLAVEDGIATVTLDRQEKMNALSEEMYADMTRIFEDVQADEAVRAVILTGAGKAFCSGSDVGGMANVDVLAGPIGALILTVWAAVVQFDVKTKKPKIIAFLAPYYKEKYNYTPDGTYSVAMDDKGENLFVTEAGWARGAYLPAYARRYPFCMARVNVNKVAQKDRLICVEKARLDEENGEALFDERGEPGEKWKGLERLLSEYEADLERMREMCSILGDYGLFEPFTMQATLAREQGGGALQITGMHRVAEGRLQHLNASQIKNLLRKGILARVYLHLASLANFARLLDRKAAAAS